MARFGINLSIANDRYKTFAEYLNDAYPHMNLLKRNLITELSETLDPSPEMQEDVRQARAVERSNKEKKIFEGVLQANESFSIPRFKTQAIKPKTVNANESLIERSEQK